jgi:ribosomal protein S18 acetylase RimI-like enzyme
MAVITSTFSTYKPKQLRPFDPRHDLKAVADLIEHCFANTLDPDGKRYLRQMRAAAQRKGVNWWTALAASTNTLPLAGFVWEEAGEVVGNLSLVPFLYHGRRIYLIANVAVYPEHRRRGIARALTSAALEKSHQRRVSATWLQVRHDNQAAIDLYTKLGFVPQARRTTWVVTPESLRGDPFPGMRVTFRRSRYWSQQQSWLDQNYPPRLRWHLTLKMTAVKPGIWGSIYSFFKEINVQHWALERDQDLLGILTWQGSSGFADYLWLAAPPEHEEMVLGTLLPFIRCERRLRRPVSLDYPENRAVEALSSAGFEPKSTLIWMEAKNDRNSPD